MLEIRNLTVCTRSGDRLLEDISLTLPATGAVGLTGQSGAGKTTLIKAVMGILDHRLSVASGSILLDGVSLLDLRPAACRACCGTLLGFIPQNPMTALDGRLPIARQMSETFCLRLGLKKTEAMQLAAQMLAQMNLQDAPRVLQSYPAQLSGGMLQRVTLALTLGLKPRYILADEPTSALDAHNRSLLLQLLAKQCTQTGVLLISHDVDALCALCDTVHVMENGRITESGAMQALLDAPRQAWTKRFAAVCQSRSKESFTWTDL